MSRYNCPGAARGDITGSTHSVRVKANGRELHAGKNTAKLDTIRYLRAMVERAGLSEVQFDKLAAEVDAYPGDLISGHALWPIRLKARTMCKKNKAAALRRARERTSR